MFAQRHAFDGMMAGRDPYVFASEYAVLTDGGWGNLKVRHPLEFILMHEARVMLQALSHPANYTIMKWVFCKGNM